MIASTLLALPLVVAAGVLSFASPCFLPVVPVFVSYLMGGQAEALAAGSAESRIDDHLAAARMRQLRRAAAAQAVVFVLGFTLVFVAVWASVGLLGHVLGPYRGTLRIVGGVVIVVLGLHVAGLIELPFLRRQVRVPMSTVLRAAGDSPGHPRGTLGHPETRGGQRPDTVATAAPPGVPAPAALRPSYRRSLLMGLAFGAGWTPCIGPTLGAVIGLASTGDSLGQGIVLLLAYCLGLGIPFVLVTLGAHAVQRRMRALAGHHTTVSLISGGLLVLLGFAMIADLFGRLTGLLPTYGL
ncbi:cytochrome c-type biogenesis protein [Kineosphaera limosa]|uniref:Cytochrome c-type biogenesis protein CcdA n=1 Tax=Kineosphaera limosa NBRC 100340 TaxID=1184609 RepID=K6W4Y5_9MICO|nr:cytochrome c biogenesis CcdA family protein [Kineosphaera limosa]NYE02794.1 cytochrome c-type biogenesis protein [Kineosphaera limosa]GAB94225.1 cytochrome c-type biogenesis protein CcdA [Kineosphaera limosa NBRC 100340]